MNAAGDLGLSSCGLRGGYGGGFSEHAEIGDAFLGWHLGQLLGLGCRWDVRVDGLWRWPQWGSHRGRVPDLLWRDPSGKGLVATFGVVQLIELIDLNLQLCAGCGQGLFI